MNSSLDAHGVQYIVDDTDLSDSDWLDIASNRGSLNDVDISDFEHDDDESSSVPRSRRSSVSLASSRGDSVDAWEGFADDHGAVEASVREEDAAMAVRPEAGANLAEEPSATSPDSDMEDLRVKEALDQSVVSTLGASRTSATSAATAHSSLRDLRLSFPDPLTSSRDDLNRSYEEVPSPSETTFTGTEHEADSVTPAEFTSAEELPAPAAPVYQIEAPAVSPKIVTPQTILDRLDNVQFNVVLYGSSFDGKWLFVDTLLEKLASGCGYLIDTAVSSETSLVRWFSLETVASDYHQVSWVAVHDRTGTPQVDNLDRESTSTRPSLAIVFLSSAVPPAIQRHTVYLPVFVPLPLSVDTTGFGDFTRLAAQDAWDLLRVPMSKTLRLSDSDTTVFDSEDVHAVKPAEARLIMQQLMGRTLPTFSVTIIALLSLILGLVVQSSFRSSIPTPTATPPPSKGVSIRTPSAIAVTLTNGTITRFQTADTTLAAVPSFPREVSLAVVNTATSASVHRPPAPSEVPVTRPNRKRRRHSSCDMVQKDVILRPSSSVFALPGQDSATQNVASGSGLAAAVTTDGLSAAVSLRLADSVSRVAEATVKALAVVVNHDMQELMAALDALLKAIGQQTAEIVKQSRGRAAILRDRLEYRNERAKQRARHLRDMGDRFVAYAGERLRQRADKARTRAHALKDKLANADTVRSYRRTHEVSVARISKRLNERSKRRRRSKQQHHARRMNRVAF